MNTDELRGYRIDTYNLNGTDHTYLFGVAGTQVKILKDNKPWTFCPPGYEYAVQGKSLESHQIDMPVLRAWWFDAVLREDAKAQRDAATQANPQHTDNRWGGEDLKTTLEKVERNIVEFTDRYVHLSQFATAQDLLNWLSKHAPGQVLGWETFAVDPQQFEELSKGVIGLVGFNTYDATDPQALETLYYPAAFYPQLPVERYFTIERKDGTSYSVQPHMGIRHDGNALTHFESSYVVPWEDIHPALTPLNPSDTLEQGTWLALHIPTAPMVLLLPLGGKALLHLYTDDDGIMTSLNVLGENGVLGEIYPQEMFNRRWGAYRDENTALDPEQIRADIAELHRRLHTWTPDTPVRTRSADAIFAYSPERRRWRVTR